MVPARAADDTMPAVGQAAPTFTLPSQDGKPISLDQYRANGWCSTSIPET